MDKCKLLHNGYEPKNDQNLFQQISDYIHILVALPLVPLI